MTVCPFMRQLLSVYTASKAAVTAFTESLALELKRFNVRVRLVVPRQAATRFSKNAKARMQSGIPEAYAGLAQGVFAGMKQLTVVTRPIDVADAVWRAATDPSCPLRLAAGADAVASAA
jgi:short-subunit dehydrogenase